MYIFDLMIIISFCVFAVYNKKSTKVVIFYYKLLLIKNKRFMLSKALLVPVTVKAKNTANAVFYRFIF